MAQFKAIIIVATLVAEFVVAASAAVCGVTDAIDKVNK